MSAHRFRMIGKNKFIFLMKRLFYKVIICFLILWIILSLSASAIAADNIWGSYKKKQDGHSISMYIEPTGGDEKSGRVNVIFDYVENTGKDLEIDGVGTRKGNIITLYSRTYKLMAIVRDGVADLKIEESCGNHRFYEGYGYYSETCSLGGYSALAAMSKGLAKKK
ncbi:MAG: hypothetical protein JW914_08050 [Syntrophaceae bacterium]|nr:hypothetical protein [Syntrophaceae bacterium]